MYIKFEWYIELMARNIIWFIKEKNLEKKRTNQAKFDTKREDLHCAITFFLYQGAETLDNFDPERLAISLLT